jgi:flagellar hook protein FlgE
LDVAGGFGPGVLNASVDGSGRLVVSAANTGVHTVAVSGAGVANFFGAPTAVAGTNAVAAVPVNPDAGRSEWGLFYRNLETYDSSDSTDAVWTQISSNTSITNGKLGRTAVTDGTHAAGAAGWTPTYTNTNPTGFFFDKNGKQLDATSAVAINNLTVGGKNFGTITLDMGATEFADKNGLATANQLTQDGYSTGAFEGLSIDNNSGIISYNYSNGQTVQKWKIPIVAFNGASYLKAEDGGAYTETIKSGSPIDINGSLSSSALEASNVDISEEFTKLIVTQQAFSANSKVITTADQMMQSILQIIR